MKKESVKKLQNMYAEFMDERDRIQKQLDHNVNRIKEIDLYLDSIYKKEDSDFKVFSPRNVENVFKDTIEENKKEKEALENDNKNYYQLLSTLDSYLFALNEALPPSKREQDNSIESLLADNITNGLSASTQVSLDERLNILSIQEEERQRIARDLHDVCLQNLAHLVHKIELSSLYIDKDPIQAKLELAMVGRSMKEIIEDIRNTIYDLRPMTFDDLGFKETVERLCYSLKQKSDLNVVADVDEIQINNDIELMTIYRIIQECCSNAINHSGGTEVAITLRNLPSMYKITVKDNGKGFVLSDVKGKRDHHYGLTILNERVKLLNGKLSIDSIPDKGTIVTIQIPREDF